VKAVSLLAFGVFADGGRHEPCQQECLFLFGCNQLVAFSVDVYYLNLVIILEVLAQLCDIHIH